MDSNPVTLIYEGLVSKQINSDGIDDVHMRAMLSLSIDNNKDSRIISVSDGDNFMTFSFEPLEKYLMPKAKINTKDIIEEIDDAIEHNYEVRQERLDNKNCTEGYGDSFVCYCNGVIDALKGIRDFITRYDEDI